MLNGNDGGQPTDAAPSLPQNQAVQEHGSPAAQQANVSPPPPEQPTAEPPAPDQTATEPPPKTVQEMVEKSAKSAGNSINETQKTAGAAAKSASTALEKAGSAVGGAAKSSWECLSSFFSKC
jgi:outer membrane biosynthesis protein TonB